MMVFEICQSPTLLAAAASRTFFEWMRLRQLDEWWHWLLLALCCVLILAAVVTMYWADARALRRGTRWSLLLLRVVAFVGVLVFFLDLQKRTEQKLIKNSRVAILVDTSQSMGIADILATDSTDGTAKQPRMQQVLDALAGTTNGSSADATSSNSLIASLREKHDVQVYRFDETNQPIEVAAFAQTGVVREGGVDSEASWSQRLAEAKRMWTIVGGALGVAVLGLCCHWLLAQWSRNSEGESWALLVTVFAAIVAVVFAAVCSLRTDMGPRVAMGWANVSEPEPESEAAGDDDATASDSSLADSDPAIVDWTRLLEPRGGATRIGDAIRWVLREERGNPLAGIGVLTDGNSNRGLELNEVIGMANLAEVPLFPVGIASDLPPSSVRLVDVEAPARVYPGDEFKMTAYIQAYGLAGQTVTLQMVSRLEGDAESAEVFEADVDVELGSDGEVIPVPLQVQPDVVGKRLYIVKLGAIPKDPDTSDNEFVAKVRVVDRKSRALLIAGGPTREYRFLRNMLFRDKDSSVDVLLQTARKGISQEADEILFEFPSEPAELFEYDTIVAFDPDWSQFSQLQLELLEQWVAEKAGGLVVVAGPVHTSTWAEDRRAPAKINLVRQLYPVNFAASRIELGRYGSPTAWPLDITEDGRTAPFFEIGDNEQASVTDSWSQFSGVYGYYPVRDVKPAATVFARFSDPQASISDERPPLIVGQFYGAGRVLFLGTGEFWRLRAIDNAYFERFYIKLIRYVSEGRLLRDSNRGLLLVEKDRALRGDTIGVRASVVDAQFQPLQDKSVTVTLRQPDQTMQTLELQQADGVREGMYAGRFMATQPGDYRLELALPGDGEPVILEREVRVKLPNLEIERPQRNDAELSRIAKETSGTYYVGMPAAVAGETPLAASLISKRRETFLPGTPDRDFQQRLRSWLLALIVGALSLEWLIRRLNKLA